MIAIGIYEGMNRSIYSPPLLTLSFNDQLILRFGIVGFILYWMALCIALIIILNVGARAIEKTAGIDIVRTIIEARKILNERLQTDINK